MAGNDYLETFDDGTGGWLGWIAGGGGPIALERKQSAVGTFSPWGIDINHAPPGAGYLHLLFVLMTDESYNRRENLTKVGGKNRFVDGGYSRNLTNARMTLRLRGELDRRGSQLMLLVQANVAKLGITGNHVLLAQPFDVTPEWTEQTVILEPDPAQWLSMGTRGEGADNSRYGDAPIDSVLHDVNVDMILVLFPLQIEPVVEIESDKHKLRAGKDYPVRQDRLPSGEVWLDELHIEYA